MNFASPVTPKNQFHFDLLKTPIRPERCVSLITGTVYSIQMSANTFSARAFVADRRPNRSAQGTFRSSSSTCFAIRLYFLQSACPGQQSLCVSAQPLYALPSLPPEIPYRVPFEGIRDMLNTKYSCRNNYKEYFQRRIGSGELDGGK